MKLKFYIKNRIISNKTRFHNCIYEMLHKQHPYRIRPESDTRNTFSDAKRYNILRFRGPVGPVALSRALCTFAPADPNSDTHTHTNFALNHPFVNEHVRICLCGSAAYSGARFPVRYVPFLSERGQGGCSEHQMYMHFETFPYVLYTTCWRPRPAYQIGRPLIDLVAPR